MASTSYASGTGNCGKCGQQLLQLEGNETADGTRLCIMCEGKRMISTGPKNETPDIGEDRLNQVLAAAGVHVPGVSPKPNAAPQPATKSVAPAPAQVVQVNIIPGQSFEDMIGEALKIMRNLPMPKDVRQFKSISKIVVAMESLIQEK